MKNLTGFMGSLEAMKVNNSRPMSTSRIDGIYIGQASCPVFVDEIDMNIARKSLENGADVLDELGFLANVMKWNKLNGVAQNSAKRALCIVAEYFGQPVESVNSLAVINDLIEVLS